MVVFGDAAAAVSLTVELFGLCIESLHAISRAKHSADSLIDFNTRLDLEIARFVLWGRNSGLDRGNLDPSLQPVHDLLIQILGTISSSIQGADQLKSAYGLHLVEDTRGADTPSPTIGSLSSHSKLDILLVPEISQALQRQRVASLQLKKHTSLYKKSKWAVWDESKALGFVETIKGYVDGLNKLLTESQKSALDAETTAMRIAILGTDWSRPIQMLSILENATSGRYETLALPARLSRLRLELEMEAIAPSLQDTGKLTEGPLPIYREQLRPLDFDRCLATFQSRTMLIEWRTLTPSEARGETGKARKRQAAKLVAIFQELKSQPAEYRVLQCVGYVDQLDHIPPRLGTAFDIPHETEQGSTTKTFSTFYEYLSSQEFGTFQPSLGARFDLARDLARGFLQFHQLGWLHKNIRSHNIIFFHGPSAVQIKSPFIVGFAYSRPSDAGISDPVKGEDEAKLYQHPEYQRNAEKGYKLRHDLFSIGMLLFEVAKWRSLKTYFTRLKRKHPEMTTESFSARLVEEEKEELEFRVGTYYTTAVLTCLEADFDVQEGSSTDTQLRLSFFEKVVKSLDACRA